MKTKKIRIRQGFTIVELVIVIGVIGVLSAVLIPTFINLNNKANEAADQSLIKNLNTQLAIKRETEGKNTTMYGALQDALEAGYKVENLTPKSGKDIVWNQETDEFAQLESAPAEGAFKYWTVAKSATDLEKAYSSYLYFDFAGPVNVQGKGFDVGEYSGVSVNYTGVSGSARSVVIRTNGGKLTVNAPLDTVSHYADLEELTVSAIANESYHEFGKIKGKASISQGRIVVENGSSVPQVDVESATAAVTVTAKAETLINVDSSSASQTQVQVEAQHVYVNGVGTDKISGSQAGNAQLPTVVNNETQLAAAIDGGKAFIQLGADFATENGYTVSSKTLFDFAGHSINTSLFKASFITNESSLTFTDSGADGGLISDNNNIILNKGTLTVNGGKFVGNRVLLATEASEEGNDLRGVIHNNSKANLVINNIDLYTETDFGILNYGQAEINNGKFKSLSESRDGRKHSYCVSSYAGNMVINNADVEGVHGGIGINGGKGTVNNATVTLDKTKKSFYALYIAGEMDVVEATINGGTFNPGKDGRCLYVGNNHDGGLGRVAMTTVTGGNFNGTIYAAFDSNYGLGILKVEGGTFKFDPTSYTAEGHTVIANGDGTWTVR